MLRLCLDKVSMLNNTLVIIKRNAFPSGLVIFWLGGLGKELKVLLLVLILVQECIFP